jgi:hypothetical protein
MQGNPRDSGKNPHFSGFLAHLWRSAVTLHQEMSGITRHAGGEERPFKSRTLTGGSLS